MKRCGPPFCVAIALFLTSFNLHAASKFEAVSDYVFQEPLQTDALLIAKNGKIVFEKYARGYSETTRHPVWSISKSISALIFGTAELDYKISRNDFITKFYPDKKKWNGIKVENLLTMTTGLHWQESYEESPLKSDVVATLYRLPWLKNRGEHRLTRTNRVAPIGERFEYSSGDSDLLMAVLQKALGSDYSDYPWKKLFNPIGMKNVTFEQDHSGAFAGASYVYTTARDLWRVGELMLNGGRAGGKQIVSKEFAQTSVTPSSAFKTLRLDHDPEQAYGFGWWINQAPQESQLGVFFKNAPRDLYWAQGHYGQYIFVIPSKKAVIVRLATDLKTRIDREKFFKLLEGLL